MTLIKRGKELQRKDKMKGRGGEKV